MARDGNGDYTAPSNTVNPAATGTTIDPTDFNELVDDIETAFSESVFTAGSSGTDNRVVRADGTSGKKVQESAVTIDDSGNISGAGTLNSLTLPSSNFVGLTDSQTLTNKTLTSPVINVGSDAQGDIYFRNSSGAFARLAPGTAGYTLTTGGAGADPTWSAAGSGDVTAASAFSVDNVLVRSDGTSKGVQATGITVADTTNDVSGVGSITPVAGSAIRTATSDTNTLLLQAYDVDGTAYTTFATLTAGNTPTFDLSASTTIGSDTIVSLTGTQTLTNKTLTSPTVNSPTIATPTINLGSDAQGDILYRSSGGSLARLGAGSAGQVLQSGGVGADPSWTTVSGTGDVTAAANFGTDNVVVRADGIAKGVQATGISIDDSDNLSGVNNVTGADTNFVTGTAGSNGYRAAWNADGDAVQGSYDSPMTVQVLTSGTGATFTPSTGATRFKAFVIGGGGGGAGAAATAAGQVSAGDGGAAGGVVIAYFTSADLSSPTYTIGAAGSTTSGAAGGNGGTTSFAINGSTTYSATGGAGGGLNLPAATYVQNNLGQAATGGTGSNGNINLSGTPGGYAIKQEVGSIFGGTGGSTPLGSGGAGARTFYSLSPAAGGAATGYGGGGGGSANGESDSAQAGGAAGAGVIIVEEYY